MKSILLIGLGRFSKHIAIKLNELGHEVMAVDLKEERGNAVLPYVTNAQIGDCTVPDFLRPLGVRNFDTCIVTIGNDFHYCKNAFTFKNKTKRVPTRHPFPTPNSHYSFGKCFL